MEVLLDINLNSDTHGWVALLIIVAVIAFVLFRPKFKKKDPLEKMTFTSVSQQRSVERQMQNLLVELSEMARQMNAQIDTRAAKLELLIKQADQRIAELKRPESAPAPDTTVSLPPAPPEPATPAAELPQDDARHSEIYSMADQGKAASEIATYLNQPSGEIELILALRPHN